MYGGLLDELPLDRIHDCFQAIVGAEFLVDVVKVIAEGLRADTQSAGDLIAILAFGEQAQNMLFLLGQGSSRFRIPYVNLWPYFLIAGFALFLVMQLLLLVSRGKGDSKADDASGQPDRAPIQQAGQGGPG